MRAWGFWTEHKLEILSRYLNAFSSASKMASATVYLDLFAGQVENEAKLTRHRIDGSPTRALRATPPLSTVVLFEMPNRAKALRRQLSKEFPGRDIRVYDGDCNISIDAALADLKSLQWAPTFAFIDQQGTEIRWETIAKLAGHKRRSPNKVELWLLFADSQLPRGLGVQRETDEQFARQVDDMFGSTEWRAAYEARCLGEMDAGEFRAELTNFMRWRLEDSLGYAHTHAFELRNVSGTPIYSMVFATDNAAGNRIMRHLYAQAAQEHPKMREDALALRQAAREEKTGELTLFPPLPKQASISPLLLYQPAPARPPYRRESTDAD